MQVLPKHCVGTANQQDLSKQYQTPLSIKMTLDDGLLNKVIRYEIDYT